MGIETQFFIFLKFIYSDIFQFCSVWTKVFTTKMVNTSYLTQNHHCKVSKSYSLNWRENRTICKSVWLFNTAWGFCFQPSWCWSSVCTFGSCLQRPWVCSKIPTWMMTHPQTSVSAASVLSSDCFFETVSLIYPCCLESPLASLPQRSSPQLLVPWARSPGWAPPRSLPRNSLWRWRTFCVMRIVSESRQHWPLVTLFSLTTTVK